jgi:flagellar basal-body rod modification protein FlgD
MQIGINPVSNPAAAAQRRDSDNLGQADFLRLMTEQLKNQDPLKPLDSNDFLAQLAQFSTVQGIQSLNSAFADLSATVASDQALQATGLIGHEALVASNAFQHTDGGSLRGAVDSPMAGEVTIEISDAGGNVVRRLNYSAQFPGPVDFSWDGFTDTGEPAPGGEYTIAARVGNGPAAEALNPHIAARINSVFFTQHGLVLDLAGIGSVPFSAVRRVGG